MSIAHFSSIISGVMTWGEWGKNLNTKNVANLINHTVNQGITTIDHADIYGNYTTEALFGSGFKASGLHRNAIQIITKCGIQHLCPNRNNKVKHYNYNKDYIIWSAENSLKNLQTDYIDLLLLHRPSPLMDPTEIAEAVQKLLKDGKILHVGVSNFTPLQTDLLNKYIPIVANQIECSITHSQPMFDGSLDHMMVNGIEPMSWSSLGSVFKDDTEQSRRIMRLLDVFSKKYEATPDQLLLAWLLKHPAKIRPVIGTATPERIALAAQSVKIDLELEDWFLLLEAAVGHPVA